MESRSTRCTRAGWLSTAILAMCCSLASVAVLAQEVTPPVVEQPMPVPPGEQPPDPPVFPTPLPEPEIVQPPEAPPVLIPVEVQWSIPRTDHEVADDLRFVSVWCGKSADDPYTHGRWDFAQPGTRGTVQLQGPSHCIAVAYYWHDGAYRYSDASPAVLVDPLQPGAPELMPAGMETATLQCVASTRRCQTNSLQTATKTRPLVRTRSCVCILE